MGNRISRVLMAAIVTLVDATAICIVDSDKFLRFVRVPYSSFLEIQYGSRFLIQR